MSSFKDNLDEQRQRGKYQKEHFWAIFLLSSIIGSVLLTFLGFSDVHFIGYIFFVPNLGVTANFYILGFVGLIGFRWWWNGIPSYIMYFSRKVGSFFAGFRSILDKVSFFKGITKAFASTVDYFSPSEDTREKIIKGRRNQLEEFFYPKTTISDELPRVERFKYFKTKSYHIGNLFDYDAVTLKEDEQGTNRIIALFRDKKTELFKRKAKAKDPEVAKRAEGILARRKAQFHDKKIPTNEQELEYRDLFQVIEGVLKSYDGENDSVRVADYDSPLKLDIKNGKVVGIRVDESIDVFKNGQVSFSLRMITLTVARMTILYMSSLTINTRRQSRFSTGKLGEVLRSKEGMKQFEDFFKLVFFRRLLLNYGSVPSGWMCVRIESYDLRAILSAVDRPLIPTITSNNDGSNDSFNSDVLASAFLFTYWAFFREERITEIMEEIDWCFNTTKDFNEIKAREASASFDAGEL